MEKMSEDRYSHACTIAFEIVSKCERGEDLEGPALRVAILERLASIGDAELVEAVGLPFDTHKIEKDYV